MAVQKSKKSRAKRNTRRANNGKNASVGDVLSIDSNTGETHVRHRVSALGFYRGKQVVKPKVKQEKEVASEAS
tara:strand:+ start:642 stop:860 length:219 start_codon:yes stop_codon:yes gene_type:complete